MKIISPILFSILVCFTNLLFGQLPKPNDILFPKKYGEYKNGVVVCAVKEAALVGAHILKKGGNAFDAAIATQFALAVVYPQAGNIGGGGFMTAMDKSGKIITLDFRETAPELAVRDMYLDKNGVPNMHLSQDGHLSVGVPGAIAGIFEMEKYSKLPFKELIDPAIKLAEKGFAISETEATLLNKFKDDFVKFNGSGIPFVKSGYWKKGDILVQKELANTLIRIRDNGRSDFYQGKTASLIVDEMQRGKGLINMRDLASYKAVYRKPVIFDYKGFQIVSFPPPSSGGILLGEMLKMIEPFHINRMGYLSADMVHLMVEVERRAYADRAKYMGDPDFWHVPDSLLLRASYLKTRMASFNSLKATLSEMLGAGDPYESMETTHMSIADKNGNLVSITTTLNGNFGSRVVVKGAGFFLNDEMDDFSVKPGVPNMFGAVGGEANAIAPHKRMLSSMCPTIVLKNNKPFIVIGTPGGTTIPTSVFQSLVDIIDFHMNAKQAIVAPKFHHQWLPDWINMESGFAESTLDSLKAMGHVIKKTPIIGKTEIILFKNNEMEAAADIRGDDMVSGF